MFAVFVGNGTAFGSWAANIPRLREAAGLGDASLGVVLLCVSVGAVLTMPLVGRYGGVLGTGRGCWMAALLLGLALPLPSVVSGWGALLAAAGLVGAGLGMMDVCMNAHAADVERRWGAAIMSSFHAGWSLGQLLGAGLAGLLVVLGLGLPASMGMAAVVVAGCGLAGVALPRGQAADHGAADHGAADHGAANPAETPRFLRPSGAVLVLCAMIALSFALEGGTADWAGVYLTTVLGSAAGLSSLGLALFAGAMVVFRLGGDALVRRLGPVRVVGWGGAATAVGLAVALASPSVVLASAGFGLVGAGLANIVPVVFTLAGRRGAAGVAMVATAGYGAVMATPPLIGFVSQQAGLRTALLLLLLASAAVVLLARRLRS